MTTSNKTINTLDNLIFKYTHWRLKEIIDFAIPVFIALYIISDFYNTNFNTPILFWHESKGIHHTWDLLALYLAYFVMKLGFKFSSMKSLICLIFIVAVEEESWYIIYYFTHPSQLFAMTWIFSPVNLAYALIIIFYVYYGVKANLPIPLFFLLSVWTVFAIWIILGFHLSVDFFGSTQYFLDIQTNEMEISHWIIPICAYLLDVFIFIKLEGE